MNLKDIRKIARKAGVRYHHHDAFDTPRYTDHEELKDAVVVVYSTQYGHWTLAINQDGTIVKPGDSLKELAKKIEDMI